VKNIKWIFVFYSLAAMLSMAGIGIAVGFRSIPGILLAIVLLGFIMARGFKKKKKMIEAGLL
jgi:hypothetical protein